MKDKVFLDTNILVYLSSKEEGKSEIIRKLIYNLQNDVISTQVLGEFSNVAIRNKVLSSSKLVDYIDTFANTFEVLKISDKTIINAIKIKDKYLFSFWDSMIVASAIETNCKILFSEDMHHNQLIDNVLTIKNPFIN